MANPASIIVLESLIQYEKHVQENSLEYDRTEAIHRIVKDLDEKKIPYNTEYIDYVKSQLQNDSDESVKVSKKLYDGKFLDIVLLDNGWEQCRRKKSNRIVSFIPYDHDENKLILILEYRATVNVWQYSIASGLHDEGEYLHESAARELLEETGYSAKLCDYELVERYFKSCGMSDEYEYIYMSTKLTKVSDKAGVDGEKIFVVELDLSENSNIIELIKNDKSRIDIPDIGKNWEIAPNVYVAQYHINEYRRLQCQRKTNKN